jgi:hypothetical protein
MMAIVRALAARARGTFYSISYHSAPPIPTDSREFDLAKRLNSIEKEIDSSGRPPTDEKRKEIINIKRHLARLSDDAFKKSCEHNSLEPLKWQEGMPEFDGKSFPSILMRPNENPRAVDPRPRKVISIDEGLNPMGTAVDLDGNVVVGGYGMCDKIRNADRKSKDIQSKIDKRGNVLAKEHFDALQSVLNSGSGSKERNKARSKYDAIRARIINDDPLCKYWKEQKEKIKVNIEQKCRVAREEFSTFVALFDVVIIGKNDLKKWHKDLSHASSSVLSAISLGKLHTKIKFKVSLVLMLGWVGRWPVCGSE